MANPQQPELARSRKTAHQDQDSVAAVVDAQRPLDADAPPDRVPTENRPGHHPPDEQDKPDLDAFAERLGVAPGPSGGTSVSGEAAGASAEAAGSGEERDRAAGGGGRPDAPAATVARWGQVRVGALVAGLVAVVAVVVRRRRRSRAR